MGETAYMLRANKRRRLAVQAAERRAQFDGHTKAMERDKILRDYEEAYLAVHGQELPRLFDRNGWVDIGFKRVRLKLIPAMTRKLWAQLHEGEINNEQD